MNCVQIMKLELIISLILLQTLSEVQSAPNSLHISVSHDPMYPVSTNLERARQDGSRESLENIFNFHTSEREVSKVRSHVTSVVTYPDAFSSGISTDESDVPIMTAHYNNDIGGTSYVPNIANRSKISLWLTINFPLEYFTTGNWKCKMQNFARSTMALRRQSETANSIHFGTVRGIFLNITQTKSIEFGDYDHCKYWLQHVEKVHSLLIKLFEKCLYPYVFGLIVENIEWWCRENEEISKLFSGAEVLLLSDQRKPNSSLTNYTTSFEACRINSGDARMFELSFTSPEGTYKVKADEMGMKKSVKLGSGKRYRIMVVQKTSTGSQGVIIEHIEDVPSTDDECNENASRGRKMPRDSYWPKCLLGTFILVAFLTCLKICIPAMSEDKN